MSASSLISDLNQLTFEDRFVSELPGDPVVENHRRQVVGACYSRVLPQRVSAPECLAVSDEMLLELGLDPKHIDQTELAAVFSGNQQLEGMKPYAMCYGGHQFGQWAGQLGDGRAINLGEVKGVTGDLWTLQLKGAGPTPYSRTADGLAVLRSSIREFIASEAMYHLGIPTTRALCLVGTGEKVMRDMFYDGNARHEPGAIVCRCSRSFLRLGSYQIFAARRDEATLRQLADFTIRHHFPEITQTGSAGYVEWFRTVLTRTAETVAHWMRVGFVHGVMNTDNLSVLGETIDYGPFGWLDDYDPNWTPNTTDASGRRYCYGRQPHVAHWNLAQFANAIVPIVGEPAPLQEALDEYPAIFDRFWQTMVAAKLGFDSFVTETDSALVDELFELLTAVETDMTIFFRELAEVSPDVLNGEATDEQLVAPLVEAFYQPLTGNREHLRKLAGWLRRYLGRSLRSGWTLEERRETMLRTNPKFVPRNYLCQVAIDAATAGKPDEISKLLEVLRKPYDDQPQHQRYAERRPDWARHRAGCSMLSCSS